MPPSRHRLTTALLASLLATGIAAAGTAKPLSPLALSCQGCHQPAVDAATMQKLPARTPLAAAAPAGDYAPPLKSAERPTDADAFVDAITPHAERAGRIRARLEAKGYRDLPASP